ncbi:MAG: tetratricopeptide repeat protein [Cytophagales bacterium]|nr:tetratricopeptide repeat protein [Cytophagales bacterium]
MKKIYLFIGILLCLTIFNLESKAQNDWDWGLNRQIAEEKYILYTDYLNQKDYANAIIYIRWLLENTPKLNKSLYIDASKIYGKIVKTTKDAELKIALQDSALLMFDLRIQYFGDTAKATNRKGLKAWLYLKSREGTTDQLFDLYEKIFRLNGFNTFAYNTKAYMDLVCKKKKKGDLTDEEVLDYYGKIIGIIDFNIDRGKKVESWQKMKNEVNKLLTTCVSVDCDFVRNNLGPKFRENKDDIKLAKQIYSLMLTAKCAKDPLFIDAAETIISKEPSFGLIITTARICKALEQFDRALKHCNTALPLADNAYKKGTCYYEIADLYSRKGQKAQARSYARKALSADPGKKEAYILIGNLYYNSAADCKVEKNEVISRACYFAAYDQYEKAGAKNKMEMAKAQFPTMQQIFGLTMDKGQVINTGCWINENVKIRRR